MKGQVKDYSVISLMSTDNPVAVYKKGKGIIGKVNVKRLNSFTNQIEDVLLFSPPNGDTEADSCFIELWSDEEHVFFKRANRKHLEEGLIVEYNKPRSTQIKKSANNLTDEELEKLVVAPFMKLKKTVEKMTTEAALTRVIKVAEEAERPEKTMQFLRERLSVLQSGELEEKN